MTREALKKSRELLDLAMVARFHATRVISSNQPCFPRQLSAFLLSIDDFQTRKRQDAAAGRFQTQR